MNKAELVMKLAEKTGLTKKQAAEAIDAFVSTITEEVVNGEKVTIVGFGTFFAKERAPHIGRNPATREPIKIPAGKAPVFKAGKTLKEAVRESKEN